MTDPLTPGPEPQRRKTRWDRIHEEIEANRRGEYVVPTWALFLTLVAIVGGLALLVILAQ